ncbi:MAG: methylmalonyl Co-A mutase-associated GTPase MeaB [Candidatus Kapabacteria bacterium]|jgi:LAO/AO transport system kinase|nr:methylmalonyl Co-A mutase-associated GTPase MeaB [Candidatus Kapabacteria bacterium]
MSDARDHAHRIVESLTSGNRRALSRALSLLESIRDEDRRVADHVMELVMPIAGSARRIGFSGPPGVGKSTLIERFGMDLVLSNHRVAVLAVDPSSKRTGGSILGDKTRMAHLGIHERAFVRPQASHLMLGGTAASTGESIALCEAAGYTTVVIETVGVGQSEIDVAELVDCFVLLVLPTSGDDLQGIKRGIMEVADIVAVTKSDIDPIAARRAQAVIAGALRLMLPWDDTWSPTTIAVDAVSEAGCSALHTSLDAFFSTDREPSIRNRRRRQEAERFDKGLLAEMQRRLMTVPGFASRLAEERQRVLAGIVPRPLSIRSIVDSITISLSDS